MTFIETTFGPKTYVALKKTLSFAEVSNKQIYADAGEKLGAYLASHGLTPSGPWTVIYFTWDMEKNMTDMAIAFPVANLESVDDQELSLVTLPEQKAIKMTLEGSYEGLNNAHMLTAQALTDAGHTYSDDAVAIEEYIVDSMHESDVSKLRTDIYHLYK